MQLSVDTPKGPVPLRVTYPNGLSSRGTESPEEFVIKVISMDLAMEIYRELVTYSAKEKVDFRADELLSGMALEMPFVTRKRERLTCVNDAHVVAALHQLGATHVPVVLHISDAVFVNSYNTPA